MLDFLVALPDLKVWRLVGAAGAAQMRELPAELVMNTLRADLRRLEQEAELRVGMGPRLEEVQPDEIGALLTAQRRTLAAHGVH